MSSFNQTDGNILLYKQFILMALPTFDIHGVESAIN